MTNDDIASLLHIGDERVSRIRKENNIPRLIPCKFCGKLFPAYGRRNTCDDTHYSPCPDCGSPVEIKENYGDWIASGGPKRCQSCRDKAIGATRKSKSSEEKAKIRAKMETTMLERYGVRHPMQSLEISEKIRHTMQQNYGVEHPMQAQIFKQKRVETYLEKYGVEHPAKDLKFKRMMLDKMIEKYGDESPLRVPEIRQKYNQTVMSKYGVSNVFQSDIVKQHYKESCFDKYGVEWAGSVPEFVCKRNQTA